MDPTVKAKNSENLAAVFETTPSLTPPEFSELTIEFNEFEKEKTEVFLHIFEEACMMEAVKDFLVEEARESQAE